MKIQRTFFSIALFLTASLSGQNWSLQDSESGWNTREIVSLYYHNSELQTQWAWQALSKYRFKGTERVLDFGSGDGKLSAMISCMVPDGSVTGVDISKEMTTYASQMFPKSAYPNLAFLQTQDVDFSEITFTEKFDLVTSFCVFHLVPNPGSVLSQIKKQMKPGGYFVATAPIGRNPLFFRAVAEEVELRGWKLPPPTEESIKMRDPTKVQEILETAGFTLKHLEVVKTNNPFGTKEELIDWFVGTLSANWNIPKNEARKFFIDVTNRYLTYAPEAVDENGVAYFYLERIDFVAMVDET